MLNRTGARRVTRVVHARVVRPHRTHRPVVSTLRPNARGKCAEASRTTPAVGPTNVPRMRRHEVVQAFTAEAERLSAGVRGLGDEAWSRPTVCEPWTVRELLGHVTVAVGRLPGTVAGEAPARATVSAADYYRPDARFSPEANSRRIELGRERAAGAGEGPALVKEFDEAWRSAARVCTAEPDDRVVRTRHGDPMLLTDFLVTRVVEVAVHGLDLAEAVGREPWLSDPAGDLLAQLLLGQRGLTEVSVLGWDRVTFLRKATGRAPLTGAETAEVERAGIRRLSLG